MPLFDTAPLDAVRATQGLLSIAEVMALMDRGNIVYDPFSILISRACVIGSGNTLFPCVSLLCGTEATLTIGDGNVLHTNTLFAADTGRICVGSHNRFGEGGFTARANRPDAKIDIGDQGRYLSGASVFGRSTLGSGSQILGPIMVDDCTLEAGGSYTEADPDRRAGLFKGAGVARGLTVPLGHVIAGSGTFDKNNLKLQSFFHPKG